MVSFTVHPVVRNCLPAGADAPEVTSVGGICGDGHNHVDNCPRKLYKCKNGHRVAVYLRCRCPKHGCDWKGKVICFCHDGEKLDLPTWPSVVYFIERG